MFFLRHTVDEHQLASCLIYAQTLLEYVIFSENVNSRSCTLYVIVRPSVCRLSVTFVHPTQANEIEIFHNVSTPFGTLAICDLSLKI